MSLGGIGRPKRSRCPARAIRQAGNRSSSSFTGIATTKAMRRDEMRHGGGLMEWTAIAPAGSSKIENPYWRRIKTLLVTPVEKQVNAGQGSS